MASKSCATRALSDAITLRVSSPFVCRSCRHQAQRQRITFLQQSRSASDEPLPLTEKVRRRIWGTDNPPGLKDPYGGPSFLEKRRMIREAEEKGVYTQHEDRYQLEMVERESEYEPATGELVNSAPEYSVEPQEYVPAETWDGLEHLGSKGHWADEAPQPRDSYRAFNGQPVLSLQNREDAFECFRQAMAKVSNSSQGLPTGALDVRDHNTFQILKWFTQLSGYRVKDPMISKSKTWEVLIDAIGKDVGPKPKNIAETLMMKENLTRLPNLKIMGRRETPVDKEKEVGRWKVIEAELEERGLPVLGKVTS